MAAKVLFGPHFFPQKINFIVFFKDDYLILMILKPYFKNLFRKTENMVIILF